MMRSNGDIVDRFYGALSRGDLDAALACLTPDARIWHCFDGVAQDRHQARLAWQSLIDNFAERAFVDVRRQATASGFIQQHMMVATPAGGAKAGWAICTIIRIDDGLISRIDEYIDRAGKFEFAAIADTPTPGL